jgi:hypothetical protein
MSGPNNSLYESVSFSPGERVLKLAIPIGSAGAVGTVKGYGQDAVAHTTTGVYTITLDRGHGELRCFSGSVQRTNVADVIMDVRPNTYTAGSTSFAVYTVINAGTATDPASGDVLYVTATFVENGQ